MCPVFPGSERQGRQTRSRGTVRRDLGPRRRDSQERSECALSQELRRDALFADAGYVHEIQTPFTALSDGDVLTVREPKAVLFIQLALLPASLSAASEEQGPEDVPSRVRSAVPPLVGLHDPHQVRE